MPRPILLLLLEAFVLDWISFHVCNWNQLDLNLTMSSINKIAVTHQQLYDLKPKAQAVPTYTYPAGAFPNLPDFPRWHFSCVNALGKVLGMNSVSLINYDYYVSNKMRTCFLVHCQHSVCLLAFPSCSQMTFWITAAARHRSRKSPIRNGVSLPSNSVSPTKTFCSEWCHGCTFLIQLEPMLDRFANHKWLKLAFRQSSVTYWAIKPCFVRIPTTIYLYFMTNVLRYNDTNDQGFKAAQARVI